MISEDFKSLLGLLAAIIALGLLREVIKHIDSYLIKLFPIIEVTIGGILFGGFLICVFLGFIELYFETKIWIYLAIVIALAMIPILWLISKVRQIKETDKLNDN